MTGTKDVPARELVAQQFADPFTFRRAARFAAEYRIGADAHSDDSDHAMDFFEGFLYGVFGGVLAQLLGLFKLRHSTRASLPDWLGSLGQWIAVDGGITLRPSR